MTRAMLKIGNAQAFWGDSPRAPLHLVQQQPDLDYLTLDYLSEVSMSILAIQREKDPNVGYSQDFVDLVRALIPVWKKGSKVKIVTNAGGLNPLGCAQKCVEILKAEECAHLKVGVVYGDNVLEMIHEHSERSFFNNLETRESIQTISESLVTANAYFGAKPIVESLSQGADIVITGRVADPSLTVAPCVFHYGWHWEEHDKLANATVAGHLIECGTQVTGGFSTNWLKIPDKSNIGFPVVEMHEDGSFVITKPLHTGGWVTEQTVKEQLLYEIGDPNQYLSPDVTVSFLGIKLRQEGENRIHVSGAKGRPAPLTYKVSATYRAGYKSEAILAFFGSQANKKARISGEIILKRVRDAGYVFQRSHIECLGSLDLVPGVFPEIDVKECVMRIAVASQDREALEYFGKEIAPLVTSGPQGVCGYTSGRPKIRPVFGYWPCLIPIDQVTTKVELLR